MKISPFAIKTSNICYLKNSGFQIPFFENIFINISRFRAIGAQSGLRITPLPWTLFSSIKYPDSRVFKHLCKPGMALPHRSILSRSDPPTLFPSKTFFYSHHNIKIICPMPATSPTGQLNLPSPASTTKRSHS